MECKACERIKELEEDRKLHKTEMGMVSFIKKYVIMHHTNHLRNFHCTCQEQGKGE